MQFQSAEHEQSYRRACKAVAHARREAYNTARGMTTAELYACEPAYRAAVPGPVTGEALTQLRMVRTIIRQRRRSLANRAAIRYSRKGR